jgi:hypothetical protein
MGKCISLNLPKPPQIPPIFISLPAFNLSINFGSVGVTCCIIKLPAFPIPIVLPSPGSIFATIIATLNALILAAFPVLDTIDIPTCPMDGVQL